MTNYYIYHIEGIKIGVTTNVPRRMRQQGFTEWQHLETHTCVYEVSDREQELQRQYGLPVDDVPYHVTYFKNKSVEQRAKTSASLKGKPALNKGVSPSVDSRRKMSESSMGILHTQATKLKMAKARRTTTPEFDALVIQDIRMGMSQRKTAAKHNTTKTIVMRIIKNMNE